VAPSSAFFRTLALCALALFAAPSAPGVAAVPNGVDTLALSHLPAWLQVASATARVYTADSGEASATNSPLPQNTFLRVLGGGRSRLKVDVYDNDSGNPGPSGWVDPNDVAPSAPGAGWLVASTATTLWRSTDPGATAVRSVDRFTPLQQVDGPVEDRLEVQTYTADFSSALDRGWIDLDDTGPALPPRISVPPGDSSTTDRKRSAWSTGGRQAFLDTTAQAARAAASSTGVPASVTVAQAILESDWGRSSLAADANNFFGIKAIGSLGTDGVVWLPTAEYDDSGALHQTVSAFRAYKSLTDSVADHDHMLETMSRYAAAMQASHDPRQFAQELSEAGYSTDPDYADKLVTLMDSYDLYRFDG
jgi:Mannosyl-glycoprotein endo-beta-N-acetylglucosaminidase